MWISQSRTDPHAAVLVYWCTMSDHCTLGSKELKLQFSLQFVIMCTYVYLRAYTVDTGRDDINATWEVLRETSHPEDDWEAGFSNRVEVCSQPLCFAALIDFQYWIEDNCMQWLIIIKSNRLHVLMRMWRHQFKLITNTVTININHTATQDTLQSSSKRR